MQLLTKEAMDSAEHIIKVNKKWLIGIYSYM